MPALILLSYISLLILGLLDNVRGPFYPDILIELKLNETLGSWYFAMTSLLAFLSSCTSPWLLKRVSSFRLLSFASLVLGIAFALCATAPDMVTMLPACALFGWAYGALNVAQNVMVYEFAPPAMRRRLFSGLHSMYGLAALLAPLTATTFRWQQYGWREAYYFLAAAPILLGMICWFILRVPAPVNAETHSPEKFSRREWWMVVAFVAMLSGYLWGEISISTRMAVWLRHDLGFPPDKADFYLAGFFVTLFTGRVFFGFIHFRRFSNWTVLSVSAVLGSLTYFLGLRHAPEWLVLSGWVLAPFYPVTMEQITSSFGAKSSRALGLIIGCGSGSIVLMHLVLGRLSDLVGVTQALHVGVITLMVIALSLAALIFSRRLKA